VIYEAKSHHLAEIGITFRGRSTGLAEKENLGQALASAGEVLGEKKGEKRENGNSVSTVHKRKSQ